MTPRTRTDTADERNPWYLEYLQSPHWRTLRERKIEAAGRMCERCGEGAKRRRGPDGSTFWIGLDVHHLTYERVNAEILEDLEVLCIHCHQVEHGKAPDTEQNRIKVRRRLAAGVLEYNEQEGC